MNEAKLHNVYNEKKVLFPEKKMSQYTLLHTYFHFSLFLQTSFSLKTANHLYSEFYNILMPWQQRTIAKISQETFLGAMCDTTKVDTLDRNKQCPPYIIY